ncbi:adenylate/guanylate cyclase domain-containing protein [Methylotenera mobilis]|jgi:adenylate cyclase|uniref:Adenylate/guanylate cyclase domain-containing protein n=1 Tax=Methylotenera mobilis TaxID=359408 RepID=A0A351RCX2_9PROT|nr:adenylate/guanylate cyclase domain-containing protein [Methylotenera mobilis]PPC96841.1 MAG: adenylate/guanylate cyclase domain-containing protein [Methylotenera sp.]HBA09893.1 adenylate/guanylate cyclase domain-containing protein [Methylotenera mobilis]
MSYHTKTIMQNSEGRLYDLIAQRLLPDANKIEIDQRIWDLFGEEWCVMMTDLAGFSRQVAEYGIIHFLQTIYESERLLLPVIEQHEGFLLKTDGDSLLVIFRKPQKALQCALVMQQVLIPYNEAKLEQERVHLCIGLGFGKILRVGNTEVFGAEVNAACKLGEDLAKQGETLVTGAFQQACAEFVGATYQKLEHAPAGTNSAYKVIFSK